MVNWNVNFENYHVYSKSLNGAKKLHNGRGMMTQEKLPF